MFRRAISTIKHVRSAETAKARRGASNLGKLCPYSEGSCSSVQASAWKRDICLHIKLSLSQSAFVFIFASNGLALLFLHCFFRFARLPKSNNDVNTQMGAFVIRVNFYSGFRCNVPVFSHKNFVIPIRFYFTTEAAGFNWNLFIIHWNPRSMDNPLLIKRFVVLCFGLMRIERLYGVGTEKSRPFSTHSMTHCYRFYTYSYHIVYYAHIILCINILLKHLLHELYYKNIFLADLYRTRIKQIFLKENPTIFSVLTSYNKKIKTCFDK